MSVFLEYSKYYDLLYRDKSYDKEAKYVYDLIKEFKPNTKNILELGCGTGKHAEILAKENFIIHGIDSSKTMLEIASKIQNKNLSFAHGDVRNYRIDKKFDCIISLFHVASYQNTNDDLEKFFTTANKHLISGGLLIFDAWYGPAVLSEKPEIRTKILEDEFLKIERKASPIMRYNENVVDVNYKIVVTNKSTSSVSNLEETHKMRYFFKPEIEMFLNKNNFDLVLCEEWLTKNKPSDKTWGVCFVGIKNNPS